VAQSRAIFLTRGVAYHDVGVQVPQYCYFKKGMEKIPCILAQAEPTGKENGIILGLINLNDYSTQGATLREVTSQLKMVHF
jgi:hypothetical protein